jgi:hypothetical protein
MAYVELTYYRDCAIELREYGDVGWALHIYGPRCKQRAPKIGVIMTTEAAALGRLMSDARQAVDAHLGPLARPGFPRDGVPAAVSASL